jgi:hypothetical protein
MRTTTNTTRTARVAAVATAYRARARNAKLAAHTAATVAANQSAYMLAAQQLAAQYGVAAPTTLSVRSVRSVQQHAPSAVQGACAAVRALAATHNYVRSATLAACKQAGINPATAATQYAIAVKLHKAAATAAQ